MEIKQAVLQVYRALEEKGYNPINQLVGVGVGTAVVCFIRFMCSFLSGVLIWGNLSDGLPAWTYSLTYNGSYMLPETILTTVAAVLIYKAAPQLFAAQEQ